jgi:hypothetical protein
VLQLYYSRLSESDKKSVLKNDKEDNILDYLTLDDFVFLFVQVKNNINKWNLMHLAWKGNTLRTGRKRSALGQVIQELAEASRAVKRANGENLDDITTSSGKNVPELSSGDEVFDAIQASMWAGAMESLLSDCQNSMCCPV